MGRKSGMSAIEGALSRLARAESKSGNWGIVGWVGSLDRLFHPHLLHGHLWCGLLAFVIPQAITRRI